MNLGARQTLMGTKSISWIEGKDTWVDIGYIPTMKTHVEFSMCFLGGSTSTDVNWRDTDWLGSRDLIIGHLGSNDSTDWRIFTGAESSGWYIDAGSSRRLFNIHLEKNVWYNCVFGPSYIFSVNDVINTSLSFSGSLANVSIKLFSESPNSTSTNPQTTFAWLGFKYIKVFEDNILKMELIPKIESSEGCFFDTISKNKFFGQLNPLIYHAN